MAIQLKSDPKFLINGEELEGYTFLGFKMTKRLLEPNRMDFTFRKTDMTLTQDDIKFELREKLLGSLVECTVEAYRRNPDGEWMIDEVNGFFRGYIQHIKLIRASNKDPMVVQCTAFSPDSRMKQYPNCRSWVDKTLKECITQVLQGPSDHVGKFDAGAGKYEGLEKMGFVVNPTMSEIMPYTVQYHESDYDFLIRMAKRYGTFFYYEDGTVFFGSMNESDPITLRTGTDVEQYDYDLNMNQHTGIVLSEYNYLTCFQQLTGVEKTDTHNETALKELPFNSNSYHEMAVSAYNHSTDYFNDDLNTVADCRSARIWDEDTSASKKDATLSEKADLENWSAFQRKILEQYVMADTLICSGKARRADLKLGSVIVIEDETNEESSNSDYIQHDPLKIIDLTYTWLRECNRTLENQFKAIPQQSEVPPYLERDEQGFLTYGDFDLFPHSGPQYGIVLDNVDPLGIGRVKVVMNWQFKQEQANNPTLLQEGFGDALYYLVEENYTPWIRVAQSYAGYHKGSYLVPEYGEEVIVAFEHNNAERPYVAGVVHNYFDHENDNKWNAKDAVETNQYKAFRTKNGHTIEIRDKGKHGYIKIYDNNTHNYVVTYDTDRKLIRFESAGNIELEAKNDIVLHAGHDFILDADNDIKVTAQHNIREDARNDFNRIAKCCIQDDSSYYVNHADDWMRLAITDAHENKTEGNYYSTVQIEKRRMNIEVEEGNNEIWIDRQGYRFKTDMSISHKCKQNIELDAKGNASLTCQGETTVGKGMKSSVVANIETNIQGGKVNIN